MDPEPSAPADAASPGASVETTPGSTAPAVTAPQRVSAKRKELSLRARVALAIGAGMALLGAILGLVQAAVPPSSGPMARATGAPIAGAVSGTELPFAEPDAQADAEAAPAMETKSERVAPWRVSQLADDEKIAIVRASIDRRPLLVALATAGISYGEARRVTRSLAEARSVDRFGPKDTFSIARDKASGRVVAYEVASSPADVWQAREDPEGSAAPKLVARKLDLTLEPVRIHKALIVGADLRASLAEAGLEPVDEVLAMLDDALEGHTELASIRPGARIRVVGSQERIDGEFVRWSSLDAVEYFPATPNAASVRVYQFGDDDASKRHHGWYDAKGKQPVHGGWRMPVPLARIASRFNPHRMHPVLHIVMPHNGVDLAAPTGAPVYATAAGVVTSVGFDGPCGNKVEIEHSHGLSSVYCHLSRFAAGLHPGQHVEQRQLIAYVGQTGRVTGPHLHFGIRRGDAFIDPLSLRLDGVRVVARARRDEFDRLRAERDAELDSIPLPAATGTAPPEPETETIYEDP